MKVPKLKPGTIDQMKNLYLKHREVIEYNAKAGNKLDKAVALTIKHIAGEDFIKSCTDIDNGMPRIKPEKRHGLE
jgi:hypothetical protein